ncbi:hypothetical protein V2J09_014404 [Rumex salicifolius]
MKKGFQFSVNIVLAKGKRFSLNHISCLVVFSSDSLRLQSMGFYFIKIHEKKPLIVCLPIVNMQI